MKNDKNSLVKLLSTGIFILVAGALFAWGIYFIFCNPFKLVTSGDPGTLISAYSIFITVVLFVIGVPIALFSYSTWKKSNDYEKENRDFKKEMEDKLNKEIVKFNNEKIKSDNEIGKLHEDFENELHENEAFKYIEDVYKEDPLEARKSDYLGVFSEHFRKKHGQDAQKYFFEAIRLMNDVEVRPININDIKDIVGIYEPKKLPNIFTAIGYFSMCEEELVSGNNKKNFYRYDIYREMYNAYKSLGLRFYKHNKAIALDYLLKALEYCQKAIYEDDSYMLTYNNKSNILKDIFRLCRDANKKTRELLGQKLKGSLKTFDLNIFDFKQIGEYIEEIYGEEELTIVDDLEIDGEIVKSPIKKIIQLKGICHDSQNCGVCRWNCTEYLNKAEKLDDLYTLLLMLILESIICIKKKVLDKLSNFKGEGDDRYRDMQRCNYNCAISTYILIEYSLNMLSSNPARKDYRLHNDLKENLISAIEYVKGENKHKKEYEDYIRNDFDLKSLLQPKNGKHENEILENLRNELENIIKEKLKRV